jgi:hypothetical protein
MLHVLHIVFLKMHSAFNQNSKGGRREVTGTDHAAWVGHRNKNSTVSGHGLTAAGEHGAPVAGGRYSVFTGAKSCRSIKVGSTTTSTGRSPRCVEAGPRRSATPA